MLAGSCTLLLASVRRDEVCRASFQFSLLCARMFPTLLFPTRFVCGLRQEDRHYASAEPQGVATGGLVAALKRTWVAHGRWLCGSGGAGGNCSAAGAPAMGRSSGCVRGGSASDFTTCTWSAVVAPAAADAGLDALYGLLQYVSANSILIVE